MGRKCSHCGNNGHNSRTCNGGKECCFKLFGVKIVVKDHHQESEAEAMKKSFSTGNLMMVAADASSSSPYINNHIHGDDLHRQYSHGDGGYLSDSLIHSRSRRTACDWKKGVPWSEEEHRTFLVGLKKLGRGDWRGMSKKFVPSRSPTQIASHAQKYFLRQTTVESKKRRASVFDLPLQDQNDKVPSSDNPSVLPSNNAAEAITEAKSTGQHIKIRSRTSDDDILPCKKIVLPLKDFHKEAEVGNPSATHHLEIPQVIPFGSTLVQRVPGMIEVPIHGHSYDSMGRTMVTPRMAFLPTPFVPNSSYFVLNCRPVMVVPKSQQEVLLQVGRPSSSVENICDLVPNLPPYPEGASESNDCYSSDMKKAITINFFCRGSFLFES